MPFTAITSNFPANMHSNSVMQPIIHRYPDKFLKEIAMDASQFTNDIFALCLTLVLLRVVCYFILKWRIVLNR